MGNTFQSTLPTRGSDACAHPTPAIGAISIHAPHEGERPSASKSSRGQIYFNPRSPRGGATGSIRSLCMGSVPFQSTLPTRGSDPCHHPESQTYQHFNPRSPRGGATGSFARIADSATNFNPRSPRGGATYISGVVLPLVTISIHAPHEGERRICGTDKSRD